jgi:hypothetical protein
MRSNRVLKVEQFAKPKQLNNDSSKISEERRNEDLTNEPGVLSFSTT